MKKLISILFLFVASLFIVNSQPNDKVTYVDSLKSVVVNISTPDTKKMMSSKDNFQLQFERTVDNQTIVNEALSNTLNSLASTVDMYKQDIEERNKNDSEFVINKLGYSTEDVKHILRKERWLNLIKFLLCGIYVVYVSNELSNRRDVANNFIAKGFVYALYGLAVYLILHWLLLLIFNVDYYYIKELISIYT